MSKYRMFEFRMFRKEPFVVEAFQRRGAEQDGRLAEDVIAGDVSYPEDGTMRIRTLAGEMTVQPGDWIIRGAKGELHTCKPDAFKALYTPVAQAHVAIDGCQ
ncbi:MAG: hypothetical protein ACTHU0_19200 [Kofleriaceae bacterium]